MSMNDRTYNDESSDLLIAAWGGPYPYVSLVVWVDWSKPDKAAMVFADYCYQGPLEALVIAFLVDEGAWMPLWDYLQENAHLDGQVNGNAASLMPQRFLWVVKPSRSKTEAPIPASPRAG